MVGEKSKRRCLQHGLFRAIIIYLYHKVDVSSVLIRSALPFKLKSLWRQAAMILLIVWIFASHFHWVQSTFPKYWPMILSGIKSLYQSNPNNWSVRCAKVAHHKPLHFPLLILAPEALSNRSEVLKEVSIMDCSSVSNKVVPSANWESFTSASKYYRPFFPLLIHREA